MKPLFTAIFLLLALPVLFAFNFSSLEKKGKAKTLPTYSSERFWIALPARHDIGDTIPAGCASPENQANAQVDVFYVHPTVYLAGGPWNADLDDAKVNEKCNNCVMHQATAFNSCARIYAPRYRQGHLKCFTRGGKEGEDALDTAYADVKKAFEYYLANWNQGRPIILVGHSQGALHVAHLLTDFFDGKPLMSQLVAAYPIGYIIEPTRYKQIPVGDSATQTGCWMTWNTVEWGQDTVGAYTRYRGTACVNPLTWTRSTAVAENSKHAGGVPFDWKGIKQHVVRTQVHGTLLWMDFTTSGIKKGFYHLGSSYHVSDVNLFWMNIRENAELRVKTFMAKRAAPQ